MQAYSLECQTASLVLIYVVSPHGHPELFERMDENIDTVVLRNASNGGVQFRYNHVAASHRDAAGTRPEWIATYEQLDTFIKEAFAKPHVESWGRLREAEGHPGTLTGSLQPFAQDTDGTSLGHGFVKAHSCLDDDEKGEASNIAVSFQDARAVIRAQATESRVWELLANHDATSRRQPEIYSLLVTLEPAEALVELMKLHVTTIDAAEMVFCAALDKRDDMMADYSKCMWCITSHHPFADRCTCVEAVSRAMASRATRAILNCRPIPIPILIPCLRRRRPCLKCQTLLSNVLSCCRVRRLL